MESGTRQSGLGSIIGLLQNRAGNYFPVLFVTLEASRPFTFQLHCRPLPTPLFPLPTDNRKPSSCSTCHGEWNAAIWTTVNYWITAKLVTIFQFCLSRWKRLGPLLFNFIVALFQLPSSNSPLPSSLFPLPTPIFPLPTPLKRILVPLKHLYKSFPDNLDIQQQAPVFDIPDIVFHTTFHVGQRLGFAAIAVHLCPARDARFGVMAHQEIVD